MLNAGCGERDITAFLRANGADSVTHCDLDARLPGSLRCDLGRVPLADASFDSALCNAVLEHVRCPDEVMAELRRLLKPGGTLVVSVPFLQPYHPHPADYRRYTREGLRELARAHGFEVLHLAPLHSLAQTVGAILWASWVEKRRRWLCALGWLPLHLWSRLSRRTDPTLASHANAYVVVLRRIETDVPTPP